MNVAIVPPREPATAAAKPQREHSRECGRLSGLTAVTVAVVASAGLAAGATGAKAAPSTGFLTAPTDQLAVPGMLAGAEITPEGNIYTGWAEYRLQVGDHLRPWDQTTRTLPNPGQPLFLSTMTVASVRYTLSVFAVAVDGMPVAYETLAARNKSTARRPRKRRCCSRTRAAPLQLAHAGKSRERTATNGPPPLRPRDSMNSRARRSRPHFVPRRRPRPRQVRAAAGQGPRRNRQAAEPTRL